MILDAHVLLTLVLRCKTTFHPSLPLSLFTKILICYFEKAPHHFSPTNILLNLRLVDLSTFLVFRLYRHLLPQLDIDRISLTEMI